MKSHLALLALCLGALPAAASIIGINAPASSGFIKFDDTNSLDPSSNPGVTNITIPQSQWNGAPFSLGPLTDPVTSDTAQGSLAASFTPLSYAINVLGLTLTQPAGNSGYALMQFNFAVQFQTDAAGLPSMPTLAPSFAINGTVQGASFSSFDGSMQFVSAALGPIEGMNYIYYNNTPGPFSTTVPGVPVNGFTPALPANDTLTLSGVFIFKVDPSSINVTSTTQTAPEPSAGLLTLLSLPLLAARRRARRV